MKSLLLLILLLISCKKENTKSVFYSAGKIGIGISPAPVEIKLYGSCRCGNVKLYVDTTKTKELWKYFKKNSLFPLIMDL